MKVNKNLCYLLTILLFAASCKKSGEQNFSDNLTACEKNATCSYLFVENADLNENFSNSRVSVLPVIFMGINGLLLVKPRKQFKVDFSKVNAGILNLEQQFFKKSG